MLGNWYATCGPLSMSPTNSHYLEVNIIILDAYFIKPTLIKSVHPKNLNYVGALVAHLDNGITLIMLLALGGYFTPFVTYIKH